MITLLFSAPLFVLGLLSINSELRQLLGIAGAGALVLANIVVTFSAEPAAQPNVLTSDGIVRLGSAFLAGVLTGIPLALVYQAVSIFGRVIDLSAGLLIAEQLQPGSMERQSPTQSLLVIGAAALIFLPEMFSRVAHGFMHTQCELSLSSLDLNTVLFLTGESLQRGVVMALPVVGLLLTLELGVGLFGRYLQPINLAPELPALKLLLSVLFIAFCGGSLLSLTAENFLQLKQIAVVRDVR
jgi:flagellar biosynthesis protein FliR